MVFLAQLSTTTALTRFARTYSSHMVLQQSPQRAVVWGYYSSSSSTVQLTLDAVAVATFPGQVPGTWMAKLPPTEASHTAHTLVLLDDLTNTTTTLDDILFGDVWLCSGQSNMAFLLQNAFNGSTFVNNSMHYPSLRVFTSFKNSSPKPLVEQPKIQEAWSVSSPLAVSQTKSSAIEEPLDDDWLVFSAVCYLFGVEIMKHTNNPVGLVNTNWGGTPVEFWSSAESLDKCEDKQTTNGGAFNGMISPLLNMTLFGAVWYQGESNQKDPIATVDPQGLPMVQYGCTFPGMIADWRTKFNQGSLGETSATFYFGFVQLAPWIEPSLGPSNIRWAQSAGYGVVPNPKMPKVFNAVAIDLTDRSSPYGSVHIRDKLTVAQRLSAGGIAVAYGDQSRYWQGPVVQSAVVDRSRGTAIVTFDNVGKSGLMVRNTTGWEVCRLDPTNPGHNCSLERASSNSSSTEVGGDWFVVSVVTSTRDTITLKVLDDSNEKAQRYVVRYAWQSLPFEYKQGGVYVMDFPMPPFVVVAAATKISKSKKSKKSFAAAGAAGATFDVEFGQVQQIGSSNYTGIDGHFWMPQPLFRSAAALDSELLVTVAIHGDGVTCPPPERPDQPCNVGLHKVGINTSWETEVGGTQPGNSIIRLNESVSRGFGGLWLNTSTNTSGMAFFHDFNTVGSFLRQGSAKITGLPRMMNVAYLQSTASAVLTSGPNKGTIVTQFYGYLASAPTTGGCKMVHSWNKPYCSSVLTMASKDNGASWKFTSSIEWDGSRMPADVGGPAEPSLVVLPDGQTLLSVFRLASSKNLWMATSTDAGASFGTAQETNAWAVFPQLRTLTNGALVLTAGRPGIGLWVVDGRGTIAAKGWTFYNLAAAHNQAVRDPALQFGMPEVNIRNVSSPTSSPVMTKAYTGLVVQECVGGSCGLTVSYDRVCNGNAGPPGKWGKKDYAFSMEFSVQVSSESLGN